MQPSFDIAADLDTPVSAYLKLRPFGTRFLLESVEGGERLARYSFIGFGDALELTLAPGGVRLTDCAGSHETRPHPADRAALLALLREALARAPRPRPLTANVPLAGGLVGGAAYDLVRYLERVPNRLPPVAGAPTAAYVAPKSMLVFDHVTRGLMLLHDGPDGEREALRRDIVRALRGAVPTLVPGARFAPPAASLRRAEYVERVRAVQEHIAAGDVYQLVLSARFAGACELEPFAVYRALRLLNPSPYMFYAEVGGHTLVGSSPEALVRLHGQHAQLRPIAGTRARGADPAEDLEREQDLLADLKENAEHVMLVDLARNDLGRVARPGSVRVDPFRVVERYSHVMHMVSGVEGELAPGCDAFDLFAATFPAGTLVGAPKVRAMEIIESLEPARRGFYGGTVGYFGHGGHMDQAIAIRTLVFADGGYSYQAGAGIVADSVPDAEYDEVLAKGAVLARALALAEEGL
jgi:anthranilate synthase component 1